MDKFYLFVLYVFINIYPILGLYEDQIGKFEWIQRYIGPVERIVFDQSTSPSRRIIVSTSHNVIAALSVKSGDILWRHILEPAETGRIEVLSAQEHYISALTGNLLRTWDIVSAALRDEIKMDFPANWPQSLSRIFELNSNSEILNVVSLYEGKLNVDSYDAANGESIDQSSLDVDWLNEFTKCIVAADTLVCLDLPSESVFHIPLNKLSKPFSPIPLSSLGINIKDKNILGTELKVLNGGKGKTFVWLKVGDEAKVLHLHNDGLHIVRDVSGCTSAAIDGETMIVATQTGNSMTAELIDTESESNVESTNIVIDLPDHVGKIENMALHIFQTRDGETSMRAFLQCSDQSIHLVGMSNLIWSREEALSLITSTEFIDLPLEDAEETFQDLMADQGGPLMSFAHRIKSQALHFSIWVSSLTYRDHVPSQISLSRDKFNTHKLVIILTKSGKVFAIDNWTGNIVWCIYMPEMKPFKDGKFLLFTQRTSAHFPRTPQMVILGQRELDGHGMAYVFNPITGEPNDENGGFIQFEGSILQVVMLQYHDENYIKPILLVDANLGLSVFPKCGESLVLQNKKSIYLHLAHSNSSTLKGYSIRHSQKGHLQMSEVWKLVFTASEPIIGIYSKGALDRVHSPGRVLADRSVLYKYANPNLAVVATYGQEYLVKSTLGIHLVDLVTGSILESVSHKRVSGPFHFVHAENWVVYTCHNDKLRRNEVVALELFEGLTQANASFATSFGARATPPIVEKQAFILNPSVMAASHTTTEKGITTKFILFALKTGNVLQLSKWFLDPRRPMTQSGPREEGLVPYMPELPIPPQEIINYNQSLPIVTGIHTAPAGLESTCLVFIYGLDIYYTRVFPSKTFDVLKDDFDHWLIFGVVLSLTLAALITKKLASRKALKLAWK